MPRATSLGIQTAQTTNSTRPLSFQNLKNPPLLPLPFLLFLFLFARTPSTINTAANFHTSGVIPASTCRSPDGGDPVLCPLIPVIGSFHVPYVGLERVAPAADTHFGEIADGVLSFWETWSRG